MSEASTTEPAPPPAAEAAETREVGVLLVNLGTPEATDAAAVRRYLKQFLTDPRVIEDQGALWQLILNGAILRVRPYRKAHSYAKIWNREKDESPLKTITRSQAEKLAVMLGPQRPQVAVDWAMRYGEPAIAARLDALVARGCERILIVPLYPQYCAATTATAGDEVFRALARMRFQPALRIAPPYYNDMVYIEAVRSATHAALAKLDFTPDVILASFHGVPQAYVDRGDPYYAQCLETMRLLRTALALDESRLILTFQSRFGRAKWLEPATDRTVRRLARDGTRNIAVITPGFSADCLETLEEIAMENAHSFKRYGGKNFAAIPCLNDSAAGMRVISHLVRRELKGWAE